MTDTATAELITRRAPLAPQTVNDQARTVEVIASTGAPVRRYGMRPDESWGAFVEELDLKGADLSRFVGASVLKDHLAVVDNVVGTVEAARVAGGELRATVRFGETEEAERLWQQVRGGVVRSVSVGYRVSKWTRGSGEDLDTPVFRATNWQPLELSFVAIGADAGAVVRSNPRGTTMDETQTAAVETAEAAPAREPAAAPAGQPGTTIDRGEQIRQDTIRRIGAVARVPSNVVENLIETRATVAQARVAIQNALAEASGPEIRAWTQGGGADYSSPDFHRGLMAEVLAARHAPVEVSPAARQYAGASIVEMARTLLTMRGERLTFATPSTVIERAMGTSDFPQLLANTANKVMLQAYQAAPAGAKTIARETTARDFRAKQKLRLGEAPTLKKVNEHGEFTHGAMAESRETYKIDTYGRIIGITRQALINDDLGAFADLSAQFGQAAMEFEAQFIVDLLFGAAGEGPTMSDGTPLFHADHGNLGSAASIAAAALGDARKALRLQKGLSGKPINVVPRFLLVPASLEQLAYQYTSANYVPAKPADVHEFAEGGRTPLEPVVDPRLDEKSATGWYLAGDPVSFGTVEYAYLEGSAGPQIMTREGFSVDGIEVKCRLDFGAGVVDWRGLYRNPGAGE